MKVNATTLFPCYNLISTVALNVLTIKTYNTILHQTICDLHCDPDMAIIFSLKGSRLVTIRRRDGLACNFHYTRYHISLSLRKMSCVM